MKKTVKSEWSCYLGNGGETSDWSIETTTEQGDTDVDPSTTHRITRRKTGEPDQSFQLDDTEAEALIVALRSDWPRP